MPYFPTQSLCAQSSLVLHILTGQDWAMHFFKLTLSLTFVLEFLCLCRSPHRFLLTGTELEHLSKVETQKKDSWFSNVPKSRLVFLNLCQTHTHTISWFLPEDIQKYLHKYKTTSKKLRFHKFPSIIKSLIFDHFLVRQSTK